MSADSVGSWRWGNLRCKTLAATHTLPLALLHRRCLRLVCAALCKRRLRSGRVSRARATWTGSQSPPTSFISVRRSFSLYTTRSDSLTGSAFSRQQSRMGNTLAGVGASRDQLVFHPLSSPQIGPRAAFLCPNTAPELQSDRQTKDRVLTYSSMGSQQFHGCKPSRLPNSLAAGNPNMASLLPAVPQRSIN